MRICKNIFLVCLKNTHTCGDAAQWAVVSCTCLHLLWFPVIQPVVLQSIGSVGSYRFMLYRLITWNEYGGEDILVSPFYTVETTLLLLTIRFIIYKVFFFYCVYSSGKLFFLCNSISKLSSKWRRLQLSCWMS